MVSSVEIESPVNTGRRRVRKGRTACNRHYFHRKNRKERYVASIKTSCISAIVDRMQVRGENVAGFSLLMGNRERRRGWIDMQETKDDVQVATAHGKEKPSENFTSRLK